MNISAALLVFAVITGVQGGPWTDGMTKCALECPATGFPKLSYLPGNTYLYNYSGKTQVQLKGVEDGITETDWSCRVELTWFTPCDMAIFMKNPVIDGVPDAARFLERNPLLVAVIDGRVQHVCSHPDDETWSINIKKGVASAFQNSLPSFSAISGMIITETDVVGKCPTRYEVESEGEKVTVKKKKNHRLCKERYPTPAKTQVPWLRGPLPLAVSESTCIQEIRNGLYFTITCEDMNVVRPSYGSYKHVEAKQESVFRYLSGTSEQFATDFTVPLDNMVRKSLLYDHESLKKDPSLVAQLDHIMSQICKKTKDAVERDVATLVTKAVHLLRRVPEEAVEQTLNKIRREHFCQGNRKLESIYLDIVAFVYDSGGVRVIVNELLNGQITGFRAVLYAAALYLQPRPCIHAIEALMPLFESSQSSNYITLAAASMVNNYCRHNSNCHDEEPVRSLAEALSNKLHYQCAPSSADEIREEALTTLKALGNMGVMAPNVVKSILKCLKTENISTRIRVAVVQAFRQANCNQPVTKQLMSIAVDPTETTEVRIASYIVAISCALDEDIKNIITKISKEKNTQVRAFILSHLHNIQQSNSPEKEKLRYYLSNIAIPRNFKTDIRKYSRNIDLSYFSQSLGIGAGLESNIIYAPGSFIPRSIDFNLSAALEGFSMNIGEVGVRFEGLEPVIEEVFGPDGYLHKASSVNFFEYLISIFKNNEGVNMMSLDRSTGKKISTEFSAISNFLNKIYDGAKMKVPRADIFARILGQDIYFVSLTSNLKDVIKQYVVNVLPSYLEEFIKQMMNLETESARTAQVSLDYIFPTIQGTPVKMKLKGIGVFGMTIVSKLNLSDLLNFKISNNTMKIIPSLSLQAKAFVGFDCFLGKLGLEMNSTGSSSTGVLLKIRDKNSREQELHLELPEKMELINIKSEVYLIKSIEGTPDTKVTPSSLRDIRVTHQSCVTSLEPMLGLEFCYELQVPDIFRSNVLPLGAPSIAKVYIQKAEASIKGYLINTVTQTMRGSKMLTAKIETIGSRTSRMVDVTLSCTKQEQTYLVSTTLESSSVSSGLWTTITNNEDQTDIEAFAKYRSRETEMTKGVKVHYKTVSSLAKEEYELKMHIGRNRDFYPASQILEGKFIKKFREPENSYDILLRTKNDFRNYFDFNFEVGINVLHTSSYVLLPTKIKKFEFHTGVGGWQVTSYMRHTRDSFLMAEYSSAFKLVRRHGDLISVEATHSIRSTDDPISTTLIARIGSDGYKASSDLLYGEYKMGLTMQAVRIHDNNKILHLDVFFSLMEEYKAKLELDIPEYIRAIKFESKIEVLGPYRYLFAAAFKHGTSVIMQVEGPLLVLITQAVVHLQAHIMVDALPSGLVRISTIIISARNKQQFSFELKNHRESLFDIDFNLGLESPQKTSIESKLYITEIIQHKLEIVIKNNIAYYNMNTVLLTNTSWARRVKSFVDVDMEHQRVTGELYWDSDRNSSKKVSCDATLVTSSSIPTQASVHGSVTYMGLTYSYKTEVNAASHCPLLCGMNIEVTTPTQAMFMVSASNEVHRQASDTRMNTLVHYKSLENKHYHLTSILDLKELDNQHSFQFESEIHFMSPEDENTTLKAEVETLITSQEQAAFLKLLKESPMVTIMAAYASHTVCFDVKFQKTPSSPELFQVLAKYDKIPTGDATLAFRVVSEEVAVVDIAGVATPDDPECDGFIVKAVTHNFPLGSYDIHAKLCRPFFIELISSKRGGEIYLLKVGNQNWKTWEASLSVLATEESDETRIMIGRFLLASPMMITADIGLNPNYGQVKLAVFEELDNVLNWCTLWVKKLYHDVVADLHDGSTSPRHRLLVLVQETKKELVLIYRDLVSDDLAPGTDLVGALLGGAWTQAVWQAYLLVFMEVAQLQHYCEAVLSKLIDDIYSECYHAIQLTTQVLVKAARCVESGEVPEAVHHLVEHMQETSLFRMLKTEVETLVERYPEEYDAIQQGVDKVKHTLQHDLDEIRVKFISTVTVSKYLTWINKYLDLEGGITDLRNEIIRIFIKNLLIKVNIHDGHLQANIPLPYPTFSISQAAEALSSNPLKSLDKIVSWPFYAFPVNINNCIWAYYTLLPRHKTDLLPPYNRTAMVVSDTEILTFDGALLRAPRSPCQVVLAVYANNKLTMAHPQPAAPAHITFSTGSTTVSIKPDFSVNINGQEMSRQRTTAGEVTVHKTSREVNIILPFMTVRVFRQERVVSVDVSGWIFSHIAGLLGTYDGEIGNDWFTPSGTNASSLQELVSSWQEDKQCRTPTISPFNYKSITVRKVVKCQALLGVRSRCSFVVHPESFVKMCHAARQPCDVAQAYHIICSNKGVNRLFSYIC
ncbi:vitellogenin-like isoform X3 [Cherax quadricarinatus]|uniref:vitellogenin-like isoform X3 n=1 Tax=Cherax quadricarinatus TaxID=27406 RepID=UPI0023792930|nr:vitellogenin-like isoform X3 [Cherax quadricarinatus]